jgi:translation initiation factor IF-2
MTKESATAARPPIVAIVGHIDHGKSTLLDYIRKANVVEGEAGGITQHLSAYEATHKNASGEHKITFLDTPGHAAFKGMRARGLEAADVAILIVSSEEGAKPQTIEALKLIGEASLPYIVAFTKIDKPGSNLEKAKMSMLEHQIFLEGMGGDVPWVGISSKSGEGIPELLDLILLSAELKGLAADPKKPGEGLVIEAHVDAKRGATATLIVRDGTIASGKFVVAGAAYAPVRIMENFVGKPIKEAHPGSPVRIVGFSTLPEVGSRWTVVNSKKEAEQEALQKASLKKSEAAAGAALPQRRSTSPTETTLTRSEGDAALEAEAVLILPVVIKTDVAGTGEAVVHELEKIPQGRLEVKIVSRSVGAVTENDVKLVGGGKTPGIILGFNVKVEREARELAERLGVMIATYDIIYKLAEFLAEELEKRRPRLETEVIAGAAKVLKFFSSQKGKVVLGGRVEEGLLKIHQEVRIMRRDVEIGHGTISGLQSNKKEVKEVEAGSEFGALIKTQALPAAGDRLEAVRMELQ